MRLSEHQKVFTQHIGLLIEFAFENGIELTFGEATRTEYQQEKYVADGKSKTMKSNHLRRLAVDFNFFIDGKLTYSKEYVEILGTFWEALTPNGENRWGGNWGFVDTPHFERNV